MDATQAEADGLATHGRQLTDQLKQWDSERKALSAQASQLGQLALFTDFAKLDWRPLATRAQELETQRRELEATSNKLKKLQEQLTALEEQLTQTDSELTEQSKQEGANQTKIETANTLREASRQLRDAADEQLRASFTALAVYHQEVLGQRRLTVESRDNQQTELRNWLQQHIDQHDRQLNVLRDRLTQAEQALYRTLKDDALAPALRLEQEHIRQSWLQAALRRL